MQRHQDKTSFDYLQNSGGKAIVASVHRTKGRWWDRWAGANNVKAILWEEVWILLWTQWDIIEDLKNFNNILLRMFLKGHSG